MVQIQCPINEKVRDYKPGSLEREEIKLELERMSTGKFDIPCVIGGQEIRTGIKRQILMPHDHRHVLADFHLAGPTEMEQAVLAAEKAKGDWENLNWQDRVAIFLKAADLAAGPYRNRLNASTMLGQSKTVYQAEIDAACELIDFFRFNAFFYQEILKNQPISSPGIWNQTDYRPLEGFVLAITPFNFTAIGANLSTCPAIVGNTTLWKPANTQILSAYYTMLILREAGLPDGVIQFLPADGATLSKNLIKSRNLAGIHFTGSTLTFQNLWRSVAEHISDYRSYPRLVGETGGKDFVFVHPSADVESVRTALTRGAFEYQGQKCSAASRAYIPRALWKKLEKTFIEEVHSLKMGDVRDFRNFMGAVIDEKSFQSIESYLDHAKRSPDAQVLVGGQAQKEKGYFVEPTVILAKQPNYKSMIEEIFGPVLTIYIYEESKLAETIKHCDESTPYALTGAIFAQDRYAIKSLTTQLRNAAGNFYINDKPTGAVVGQQPFGGARASGTNDKAGSAINLYRWLSPRTIKETFNPIKDYRYPFMEEA
jgi:1-pyrroline-5-carboxylate dehydrogenase